MKIIKLKFFSKVLFNSETKKYFEILIKFQKKEKIDYKNMIFDKRDNLYTKTKSKIFGYLKYDLIKNINTGIYFG